MPHHLPPWALGHHLAGPLFPFLGGLMFLIPLLALAAVLFFLARRGHLGPPPWVRAAHAPEANARTILAERFARGDISSDEFLERASVLNWTPGVDPRPPHQRDKR